MFSRYFADRYFAPRYWPNNSGAPLPEPHIIEAFASYSASVDAFGSYQDSVDAFGIFDDSVDALASEG